MRESWCVVEVPSVGYLAYGAGSTGVEHSVISFRLAPREGVTAAWSSTEVTLVDLDTNKSMQIKTLGARPVTGRRIVPNVTEEFWFLHGLTAGGEFRLEPRIANMEVRLPPIVRDGQMIAVAPVRITDGPRTPKVVSVFALGGHYARRSEDLVLLHRVEDDLDVLRREDWRRSCCRRWSVRIRADQMSFSPFDGIRSTSPR